MKQICTFYQLQWSTQIRKLLKKCKTAIHKAKQKVTIKRKQPVKDNINNAIYQKEYIPNDATSQALIYDKLSWNIGTRILVNGTECTIQNITKLSKSSPQPSHSNDIITLTLHGKIQQFSRCDSILRSHPQYTQNRRKISRYCTVERYSTSKTKWIPFYINDYGNYIKHDTATNGQWFSVNGKNYNRWHPKIRCYKPLLNLSKNSMVFTFDIEIMQWCYAKIVHIYKNKHLNVFKMYYMKNSKQYLKYTHQFSASIALIAPQFQKDIFNSKTIDTDVDIDITHLKYYRLLLQGFSEKGPDLNKDVCSVLIDYIGFSYELMMYIESKTWFMAIENKYKYSLIPKDNTIHDSLISKDSALKPRFMKQWIKQPLNIIHENDTTNILLEQKNCECKIELNPNAAEFVFAQKQFKDNSNTKKKKRKEYNPYKSKMIEDIQKRIRIPHKLTENIKNCIKENIFDVDIFYYMLTICALQFKQNQYSKIMIFNFNFHDKHTNEIKYGIAKQNKTRGYKWLMGNKLFSAKEIAIEWNISQSLLPKPICFSLINQQKIKSVLSDKNVFTQIIKETNWCKINVYNRINNKNRLVFKPIKEEFTSECIKYINNDKNIDVIPILMVDNNTHSVQYLYVLQIPKNENMTFDIGISFKFDYAKSRFNIKSTGIHVDKQYLINQHKLIKPQCDCKYLYNFRCIIDDIKIGNPDSILNKLRAAEKRIKELQNKIKAQK